MQRGILFMTLFYNLNCTVRNKKNIQNYLNSDFLFHINKRLVFKCKCEPQEKQTPPVSKASTIRESEATLLCSLAPDDEISNDLRAFPTISLRLLLTCPSVHESGISGTAIIRVSMCLHHL